MVSDVDHRVDHEDETVVRGGILAPDARRLVFDTQFVHFCSGLQGRSQAYTHCATDIVSLMNNCIVPSSDRASPRLSLTR